MVLGNPVEPDVEEFVQGTIDSFVTWDVIVFFHDWQGFAGDAAAVAKHLGRAEPEVAQSLARLAERNILRRTAADGVDVYSYSPDPELATQIENFAAALDQREKRLALLAGLLRKGIR